MKQIFFCEGKRKQKQKHTRLFSFLFFFFSQKAFLSFFSQTSNVRPSNAPNFSQGIYLLVHRKQTLFRFENAREHHRFISPSKEGCGVGTLSSVDTPSFEQNT